MAAAHDAWGQVHANRCRAVRQACDAQRAAAAAQRRGAQGPRAATRQARGCPGAGRAAPRSARLPGRSSIERSAGPPEATRPRPPPRPSGRADSDASWQSVAVTWSSASTGGPPPTGWMRTPTTCRPAAYMDEGASSWSRPPSSRRGAAPSSVQVTEATRARSAARRVADREGDEQAVAGDEAAVGIADAHAQPGRHLDRQLDGRPRRDDRGARRVGRRGRRRAARGDDQHRGEQGKRQAAGLHAACNEDAWSG